MDLAINGGRKTIEYEDETMFHWPIVTKEDIDAVTQVLISGTMSGTNITKQFEKEFASYMGSSYALGFNNGTSALYAALWACGVGHGDEVICPSMTYWASAAPAVALGARVIFCDIKPNTLCIDENDIEHRITERTKAIMVVHYAGYPADMDRIMEIAHRHGLFVIEDNSHAQGSLYKGRKCGTIGDIGAMSLMAGKSFAIGEAGIIVTDNRSLYERCVAFGHYERTGAPSRFNPVDNQITDPYLAQYSGVPIGGVKCRMNQTCSAMGRVQLKYYEQRIKDIQDSMNYFWDMLEGLPGLHPHRVSGNGSTMGGWYYPQGLYHANELGGLNSELFSQAVNAEGVKQCFPGGNSPLNVHNYFRKGIDIYHSGNIIASPSETLPYSESIHEICVAVPWFKHPRKTEIDKYVTAFRKVIENADQIRRQV